MLCDALLLNPCHRHAWICVQLWFISNGQPLPINGCHALQHDKERQVDYKLGTFIHSVSLHNVHHTYIVAYLRTPKISMNTRKCTSFNGRTTNTTPFCLSSKFQTSLLLLSMNNKTTQLHMFTFPTRSFSWVCKKWSTGFSIWMEVGIGNGSARLELL